VTFGCTHVRRPKDLYSALGTRHPKGVGASGGDGLHGRSPRYDGLANDGLETRRWNGTKSAFADCASILV